MVSMVVYSENSKEIEIIRRIMEDLIPRISDEKWNMRFFAEMDLLKNYIHNKNSCDICIFDITGMNGINKLEEIRKENKDIFLMIIASLEISPMSYMKPSIKAASLILRPLVMESAREVIKEFLMDYIEKKEEEDPANVFKVETKGEVQYIPYNKIYYFEARKRKLYLRTLNEEYAFVSTVDNLEQILGQQFIRCHRSFIVNARKIVSIALSDNIINLMDDLSVPLSRSYKNSIKNIISRKE